MVLKHLGHEFLSDVLEIRFSNLNGNILLRSLWWSLTYALLQSASEVLGIDRNDINGCLYSYGRKSLPPAIVLYDTVPGGAGHVRRIGENLGQVFRAAQNLTANCGSCEEDTSCYACLKAYDNQFCQHLLKRGQVASFIETLELNMPGISEGTRHKNDN